MTTPYNSACQIALHADTPQKAKVALSIAKLAKDEELRNTTSTLSNNIIQQLRIDHKYSPLILDLYKRAIGSV